MKKLIKPIALSLGLILAATTADAQIPGVVVDDFQGDSFNTSTLVDGKTPMIISFWSTTCKPCMRELDTINELLPDWLDEVEFRVVAVSTDDSRFTSKAHALAEGRGWDDFIVLFDTNQEFMRAMNVSLTPQVYVVDANGKIVYSHTGYAPGNELELIDVLKSLK